MESGCSTRIRCASSALTTPSSTPAPSVSPGQPTALSGSLAASATTTSSPSKPARPFTLTPLPSTPSIASQPPSKDFSSLRFHVTPPRVGTSSQPVYCRAALIFGSHSGDPLQLEDFKFVASALLATKFSRNSIPRMSASVKEQLWHPNSLRNQQQRINNIRTRNCYLPLIFPNSCTTA